MKTLQIPFYSDTLTLIEHNGQPYAAMRPIVENMGLDWRSQQRKLNNRFHATIAIMTTIATDGKTRKMLCLPLQKLPAWLYTVHPRKVAGNIRPLVERYQAECDAVLWQYWTTGRAEQAAVKSEIAALEEKEAQSKQRGSHAARALNRRKQEKQHYCAAIHALNGQLALLL